METAASFRTASEQDVDGEGAPVSVGSVLEGVYDIFGFANSLHDPQPGISCAGGIVGLLALSLHKDEQLPKVLDSRRESTHGRRVVALIPGVSMLQSPVGLYPSRFTSADSC